MIGHEFPYTNLHDLNVDWILSIIKDFQTQYSNADAYFQQVIENIETAGNTAIEAITTNKDNALEALQTFLTQCLAGIEAATTSDIADLNALALSIRNQIQALINSIPETYQDAIDKMQILTTALTLDYHYPALVQGVYGTGSTTTDLVSDSKIVSTTLKSGCYGNTVHIEIESGSAIIYHIKYWTGWGSEATLNTVNVSNSSVPVQIYDYTFPLTASYFTIDFCESIPLSGAQDLAPTDFTVSIKWDYELQNEVVSNTSKLENMFAESPKLLDDVWVTSMTKADYSARDLTVAGNERVSLSSQPGHTTYICFLPKGSIVYGSLRQTGSSPYYAMTFGDGYYSKNYSTTEDSFYIQCMDAVRYKSTESGFPTAENPYRCIHDTVLALSVKNYAPEFYIISNETMLSNLIDLNTHQLSQVKSYLGDDELHVHKRGEWFYVMCPTIVPGIYIRYGIEHNTHTPTVDAPAPKDIYEIRLCDLYSGYELVGTSSDRYSTNTIFPITTEGQWELAIKLDGDEHSHIGGKNHGWETLNDNDIWFFVDGVLSALSQTSMDFTCKTFSFMTNTSLYNDVANAETGLHDLVAVHANKTTISIDGVIMEQALIWKTTGTLNDSFICMFPLCRGDDEYSETQVTDRGYDYITMIPYDIGTAGFQNYMNQQIAGRSKMTAYGTTSGIDASAEIVGDFPESHYGYIRNDVRYNKMYFTYGTGSDDNFTTDDVWMWKNIYKITYKN